MTCFKDGLGLLHHLTTCETVNSLKYSLSSLALSVKVTMFLVPQLKNLGYIKELPLRQLYFYYSPKNNN